MCLLLCVAGLVGLDLSILLTSQFSSGGPVLSCSTSCLADGLLDGVVPSDMAKTSVVSPLIISALAFQQRSSLVVSHIPDTLASLSVTENWAVECTRKL